MERTLAIIKPDAVENRCIGSIVKRIESEGFRVCAMRLLQLTTKDASSFYAVHNAKPFFSGLISFMCSGPVVVLALEAPDAISRWRQVMGNTDPQKAAAESLRREFGTSIERNATHGSDAVETATSELAFFFRESELS